MMTKMLENPKELVGRDVDLLIEYAAATARDSFSAFRRLLHPEMLRGPWTDDVEAELQLFHDEMCAGRRPELAIMAPPQHGKSSIVTDFIAWIAGKNPNCKTIFASYSEELGARTNRDIERMMKEPLYAAIFPETRIGLPGWQCNANLIEYVDHAGSFRNTTVLGAITGQQLDLGVIDDPVKGRHDVSSRANRDRVFDWYTDDFSTRFSANGGLLIIMTRWHEDDLLGRILKKFPDFKVLRYQAIAETDEPHRKKGDPLFPALKPLSFLLQQKRTLTQASFEALYQQNPYVVGGGELPIEKLRVLSCFDRSKIIHSVRYWDKAGTDDNEDAAYTAGVLMHKLTDGTYLIEHIARGHWRALDREQRIKAAAIADQNNCKSYEVIIEQEPGSGGQESAEYTIRNLAGFRVKADKVTGSKVSRAEPFAAQVQDGNVWLVAGTWVQPFHDECETWPHGRHKDQVDAAVGAFNRLVKGTAFSTNYPLWSR